jgi:nicotinamide-nucleotide amidase
MNQQQLNQVAEVLMQRLLSRSYRLATVESCTGGWVAKAMTDLAGSSAVLECGFVT